MNQILKDKGIKSTKQREIVLDLINKLKDQATAINISNKCINTVDKSTVYRILDLFVDEGIILKEINYNNENFFKIKEEHGHYFTCIKCHKREKIEECPVLEIENDLVSKKGYIILSHTVEINGVCNKCFGK